jgi:hypothetical protein
LIFACSIRWALFSAFIERAAKCKTNISVSPQFNKLQSSQEPLFGDWKKLVNSPPVDNCHPTLLAGYALKLKFGWNPAKPLQLKKRAIR